MMRNYFVFPMLLILFVTLSCGGGGGSDTSSGGGVSRSDNGVPSISVNIEPKSVCRGGTTTYSLEWYDSDADITIGHYKEEWGYNVYTKDERVERVKGISGSLQNPLRTNPAATPGPHRLSFWVTDAKGNNSNIVAIEMTILNCVQGKDLMNGDPKINLRNIF